MKRIYLGLMVLGGLVLLLISISLYGKLMRVKENVTTVPVSENVVIAKGDCSKKDLQETVNLEGAAGSIYANFEIKNISKDKCSIAGENTVQLKYDSTINNIKVNSDVNTSNKVFSLDPGASISATARIPNGPQCSGEIAQTKVNFIYTANKQVLTFSDLAGNQQFVINSCLSDKEITQITLSSLKK